jgi:CheY-like chemotaxis protein
MNSLLIYNNNINQQIVNQFEETCGKTVAFNIGYQEIANPNFSFDKKVTEILNQFESQEFDVIFIPFSLSEENYIEFLGLQFAYHIRLTQSFNNTMSSIVFFGNESPEIINKITNAGVILFTPGVYCTTKSNVLDFKKQIAHILENRPKISKEDYTNNFLERINIQPPSNYSTHHSIANEWSILRWAKALSVNKDKDIGNIESKIGASLYFKFLNAKYPIKNTNKIEDNDLELNNNGKVLYIDDEAEKGWSELFSELLYTKCGLEEFDGELGYEFKGKEKQEIIDLSIEKVKEFKPDVVILDLRLHDEDFEIISHKEISGFQILNKIKELNKGIQVIIFSATNKIWNLLELQKEGADGFILKESPELSIDPEFTKQSIISICNTIDLCLEKLFLKQIYSELTPLIQKVKENEDKKHQNYNLKLQQGKLELYREYLDSAEFLLYSNFKNLKYSYLQFILIIEDIVKSYYIKPINDKNHYVEQNLNKILCIENDNNIITLKLNPVVKWSKFDNQDYHIITKEDLQFNWTDSEKVIFNYRLNCVLYFIYGVELKKAANYSQLYRKRSSSVAHIGSSKVDKNDILKSIDLLNILIS